MYINYVTVLVTTHWRNDGECISNLFLLPVTVTVVFSWLLAMFDGLKLDTPNISCSEPDTVCICDIEV